MTRGIDFIAPEMRRRSNPDKVVRLERAQQLCASKRACASLDLEL
jgi:hypothetical protein